MEDLTNFDIRQPLTLESLQTFMNLYFPDRRILPESTEELFKELSESEIELIDILDCYLKSKDILWEVENEDLRMVQKRCEMGFDVMWHGKERGELFKGWAQTGIVRIVLYLTHDDHWNRWKEKFPLNEAYIERIERWRKRVAEMEK